MHRVLHLRKVRGVPEQKVLQVDHVLLRVLRLRLCLIFALRLVQPPLLSYRFFEALLEKLNWQAGDVDLYEVNEAFAVVTMAAMRDLELDHERVNLHGGACALGHPIGASGARIIVTLLAALQRYDMSRGVASLCIGGGEATAMAFEKID